MSRNATQSLTDALAALVREHDRTGTLVQVLTDATDAVSAVAAAILVTGADGELDLLAATSHAASELEVYQAQHHAGPCVDAVRTSTQTSAANPAQIRAMWPAEVAERVFSAGFHSLHASPMRWYGRTIGALNTFYDEPRAFGEDALELAQAFADVATLVIMAPEDVPTDEVRARLGRALRGTTVLERAKGVLAHQRGVDLATAYSMLVAQVTATRTLTQVAHDVVTSAQDARGHPRT